MESTSITQLHILDSEISLLKAQLGILEQRRTEWSEHLSWCQSLFAPIRALPTELLQLIFKHLTGWDGVYTLKPKGRAIQGALAFISSVSRVSHHWRYVALACPGLWATIHPGDIAHFTATSIQNVILPRTIHCGVQSGLNVILLGESDYGNKLISSQSHLIQRLITHALHYHDRPLQVTCHQGWANLTHLELGTKYGSKIYELFELAPKLHTITAYGVDVQDSSFPWAQIRVLILKSAGVSDLKLILPIASNLESLTVEWEDYRDYHLPNEFTPIISSSLHTVKSIAGWERLFRSLTLPNVHTLHITSLYSGRLPKDMIALEFHAFQLRSQCQILVLSISGIPLPSKHLIDFLRLIPTLQDFTLVQANVKMASHIDEEFIDSLNATQDTLIVPKLKSLSLELVSIAETHLVNAVLSRQHSNSSRVSSLEFISVVVTKQVFDTAVIDPIVQLRAGGLRLILQDSTLSRY